MVNLEESRYQFAELRISIYGRALNEWERLAEWGVRNVMFSTQVRWIIQVPRIFNVFVQVCMFIDLSVCFSGYPSVCLSICRSVFRKVCLSGTSFSPSENPIHMHTFPRI